MLERVMASPAPDAIPPLAGTTAFPPILAASAPAIRCQGGGHSRWHNHRSPQCIPGHHGPTDRLVGVTDPDTKRATTLVIGDSIIQNVRLRGARTVSFPSATVTDITGKLISVLGSQPQVNNVIIHMGTNDLSRQQSEILKRFNQLAQSRLHVFISGPTCGRGSGHFSRLLRLNTWLPSASRTNNFSFIANFDGFFFWGEKTSFWCRWPP